MERRYVQYIVLLRIYPGVLYWTHWEGHYLQLCGNRRGREICFTSKVAIFRATGPFQSLLVTS
jgi:hypothetical protein